MKPEHYEIIEAMGAAIDYCQHLARGPSSPPDLAESALRAAAERGYRLARPKNGYDHEIKISEMDEYLRGWYDALASIETITLDEEQDNG